MERVLVTGGAGFIGSNLCRKLLSSGKKVICLDNLCTSTYSNISELLLNPNFEMLNVSVTEPFEVDADTIYNLACPASPIHYQADTIMTLRTNFLGAYNSLEAARKNGAIILQASTSEIYGDPLVHPQREEYWGNVNPIGPRACYDEGKRIAETLFSDYRRKYDLDTKIVRIFNTYGPRMMKSDGRVISNFIVQALNDQDITIYGDGSQTRSFCYVDDLVDGMIMMMEKEGVHGPVNLGNPHEITIKELADIIISITKSRSKIVYKSLPEDDPHRRRPDISSANSLLGWKPVTGLEEGLKKTIQYFRSGSC